MRAAKNKSTSFDRSLTEYAQRYADKTGKTNAITLAHRTNARKKDTVSELNTSMRRILFGQELSEKYQYNVGERIHVTSPFLATCETGRDKILHTCDSLTITHMTVIREQVFFGKVFTTYELTLNNRYIISRVHESNNEEFQTCARKQRAEILEDIKRLKKLSAKKYRKQDGGSKLDVETTNRRGYVTSLWSNYHTEYKKIHAPIDYAYALSVHKSQGSTYDEVFIYLTDFLYAADISDDSTTTMTKEMFFRLLYVSLSRSKSVSYLF
jgi:hypothetical protein